MIRWKVLVFPSGTEVACEIYRSLARNRLVELIGATSDDRSHGELLFACHKYLPSVYDTGWEDSLQELVDRERVTHIFPAHDDVIVALSRIKLGGGVKVVTSPPETCRITRSKTLTYDLLYGVVPVPLCWTESEAAENLPVFAKPDAGQGSHNSLQINHADELSAWLRLNPRRVLMEVLTGEEYTVDCFTDRTRGLLYVGPRIRSRTRSGIGMQGHPVELSEARAYAEAISGSLQMHGAWFFQIKRASDGILKLLEVAPRIGGTSALSRVQGVNLPLLSLYESDGDFVEICVRPGVVEINRALVNRYQHNVDYHRVYVDLDDTLVVRGRVDTQLLAFLQQSLNRNCDLVLVTRHAGNLAETLAKYRLQSLFSRIIHLQMGEPKSSSMIAGGAIFIDDSYQERKEVFMTLGIPSFDPSEIELLMDERSFFIS